jgi:hypothetical protein
MKEKFYHIQIAYNGVIPYINRRGPIRDAEMTEGQILELQKLGVEVLDLRTGEPITFYHEPAPVAAATKKEAEEAKLAAEQKAAEEAKEAVSEKEDDSENSENGSSEAQQVPASTEGENAEKALETEGQCVDTDPSSEESSDPADTNKNLPTVVSIVFLPDKVEGYDAMSNSKKKKIRHKFNELAEKAVMNPERPEESMEPIYKAVNEYAAELGQKSNG